jgi:hypothetical protein
MRTRPFALLAPLLAIPLAVACGPSAGHGDDDDDPGAPDARGPDAWSPGGGGGGGGGDEPERCEKIDLLFVIDNSGSMGQEQENLGANFPAFIDVIEASGLDYRVAVTTTGVDYSYYQQTPLGNLPSSQSGGDNGAMRQACGMPRRWIEKTDPDPAGTFACAANVGTSGPSREMPLRAMRMAFAERMADGTNQGWRRPDALLGIVFVTDENDCSYEQSVTLSFGQNLCSAQMEPVATYVGFLDQYTGARARWAAVAIAGPGPGSCSSEFGNADYAQRLDELVQLTGANARLSSICSGDLTTGLVDALEIFSAACEQFPPVD